MARLRMEGTAKAIAIFAVILIVSTGLCGMTMSKTSSRALGPLAVVAAILSGAGMLTGVVGVIGSIAAAVLRGIRLLFEDKDAGKRLRITHDDQDKGDKR